MITTYIVYVTLTGTDGNDIRFDNLEALEGIYAIDKKIVILGSLVRYTSLSPRPPTGVYISKINHNVHWLGSCPLTQNVPAAGF